MTNKTSFADKLVDARHLLFRVCEVGVGVCEALTIIVGDKVLTLNVAHAGFKAGNALVKAANSLSSSSVITKEWEPFSQDMIPLVFEVIKKYNNVNVFMNEWTSVSRYTVDGIQLLVESGYNRKEIPASISYRKKDKEKILNIIRQITWNKLSSIARLSITNGQYGNLTYKLYPEEFSGGYKSENYNELSLYSSAFLAANKSRSILLYGPPGTGKSTIAQMLVSQLNLRTLIIPIEELEKLTLCNMTNIINLVLPEAIIIDDFDKSEHNPAILSVLELFTKRCKLVISTANDINYIKEKRYLVRPKRFDKLVKIDTIDSQVIIDLLGPYQEFYEAVKTWPASFIQELRDISDVLGVEQGRKDVADLAKRVKYNKLSAKPKNPFDKLIADPEETVTSRKKTISCKKKKKTIMVDYG